MVPYVYPLFPASSQGLDWAETVVHTGPKAVAHTGAAVTDADEELLGVVLRVVVGVGVVLHEVDGVGVDDTAGREPMLYPATCRRLMSAPPTVGGSR